MNDNERAAYFAAYRAAHRKEVKAYSKAYYIAHREKWKAYAKANYAAHPEKMKARAKAYYSTHPEKKKKKTALAKIYSRTQRALEIIIVAQRWGDDIPRCRSDLTPGLSVISCFGALQIDHINGGGRKELMARNRSHAVINGTRALDDLRILCELHQACYAILHGDSVGGSLPEDWEGDE